MFALGIDWQWVAIIAAFWLGFFVALGALIWAVGWLLARRDARRLARRPLAQVVELDLHRARRRPAQRRTRIAHGHIHHHGSTPGGTAA